MGKRIAKCQRLASKLARLTNSSVGHVRDADLRAVVGLGDERTALHFGAVDVDIDDVAAHLRRVELDVMEVAITVDDAARQLALGRARDGYRHLMLVVIL